MLPLLDADFTAAHKTEMRAQAKHLQYLLCKINPLGRANPHGNARVGEGAQSFWYAGVQHVFRVTHVRIAFTVLGHQCFDVARRCDAGECPERLIQGRPDACRELLQFTCGVSEVRQRVVDGAADSNQRIAERSIQVKQDQVMWGWHGNKRGLSAFNLLEIEQGFERQPGSL